MTFYSILCLMHAGAESSGDSRLNLTRTLFLPLSLFLKASIQKTTFILWNKSIHWSALKPRFSLCSWQLKYFQFNNFPPEMNRATDMTNWMSLLALCSALLINLICFIWQHWLPVLAQYETSARSNNTDKKRSNSTLVKLELIIYEVEVYPDWLTHKILKL